MQPIRGVPILVLALGTLTACEKGQRALIFDDDLADSFRATHIEFVSAADARITRDLVSEGADFQLTLREDGSFSSAFGEPAGDLVELDGSFDILDERMTFNDDPFLLDELSTPRTFDFMRLDDRLDLIDTTARFDFDGDGLNEDAVFRVFMQRR